MSVVTGRGLNPLPPSEVGTPSQGPHPFLPLDPYVSEMVYPDFTVLLDITDGSPSRRVGSCTHSPSYLFHPSLCSVPDTENMTSKMGNFYKTGVGG